MIIDLINREEVLNYTLDDNPYYKYVLVEDIKALPSANIMECARAIKKWCDNYDSDCIGCPFKSKDQMYLCAISHDLPKRWDLPEEDTTDFDPNDLTHIFDGVTEIPKDAFKGWTTEALLEKIGKEREDK